MSVRISHSGSFCYLFFKHLVNVSVYPREGYLQHDPCNGMVNHKLDNGKQYHLEYPGVIGACRWVHHVEQVRAHPPQYESQWQCPQLVPDKQKFQYRFHFGSSAYFWLNFLSSSSRCLFWSLSAFIWQRDDFRSFSRAVICSRRLLFSVRTALYCP